MAKPVVTWVCTPVEVLEGETNSYQVSIEKLAASTLSHQIHATVHGSVTAQANAWIASCEVEVGAEAGYAVNWGTTRSMGVTETVTTNLSSCIDDNNHCLEKTCWCVYRKDVTISATYGTSSFNETWPTLIVRTHNTAWRLDNDTPCPACPTAPPGG